MILYLLSFMLYFMRQKGKQRNSEVMGQCSPAELLDEPLTHGSHPSIQPASYGFLYESHPVSLSRGLTATVSMIHWSDWREMSQRSQYWPVSGHVTLTQRNTRTQNGRRGGQEIDRSRAMPRGESPLDCQSEKQRCAAWLLVSPPLHVTRLRYPWVCCTGVGLRPV